MLINIFSNCSSIKQIEAGERGYIDVGFYEKKNCFDKDLFIENAFVRRKKTKSC